MKILIIEDEYSLADVLQASLQKEGHEADTSFDGASGMDKALTGIYDVILLDIMLPVLNGYEVLRRLRNEAISTPVILLTAKSELDDKLTGFDAGADDYLTKPFEMQELFARIRAITKRGAPVLQQALSISDLELNIKSYKIRNLTSGKSVNLSSKEARLLEYLLRNQGQIISREQITNRIWGFSAEAEYNNVDVYISFVRKKISFIDSAVKIKAVRGMGYTIGEPL